MEHTRFVRTPVGKQHLWAHLIEMHGQVWPTTVDGWSAEEVRRKHDQAHGDDPALRVVNVAHTHQCGCVAVAS